MKITNEETVQDLENTVAGETVWSYYRVVLYKFEYHYYYY